MAKETLGQLIKRLRGDLTQGQLSYKAQVPREWLSVVETDGIKKPDRERLEAIAIALDVPPSLILSAAGYRVAPLPPPEEPTIEDLLRRAQAALRREGAEAPIRIGVVEQYVSGGPGSIVDYEYLPPAPDLKRRSEDLLGIRVSGNCMAPKIEHGDTVIIDLKAERRPGQIVVALHDNELLVKRLVQTNSRLQLVANQDREPIDVDGDTRILGVVVRIVKKP